MESVLAALPYALRGVATEALPFTSIGELVLPPSLSPSQAEVLLPLLEPCVSYHAIAKILARDNTERVPTLLNQALLSGVRDLLRGYFSLVGEVEARSASNVLAVSDLQKLLQSATLCLRLFYTLLCAAAKPDILILDTLHEYTQHGDPLIRKYATALFDRIYVPFSMLKSSWETRGSLDDDVHGEFFVTALSDGQFALRMDRIPQSIISTEEAERSFERGRALYFIRVVCGDSDFDGDGKAFNEITHRAADLLLNQHGLTEHLRGLRDYMLLGSGDFVDALLRNDGEKFLTRPVANVAHYMATEFVTRAIDEIVEAPRVKQSIDAYILGLDGLETEWPVWEAFVGKYHIDAAPLRAVLDDAAMTKYEQSFASLWRVRLCAYIITDAAARLRRIAHSGDGGLVESLAGVADLHSHMRSLIFNLQEGVFYNVVDRLYAEVIAELNQSPPPTLEEMHRAHATYIERIAATVAASHTAHAIRNITRLIFSLQHIIVDVERAVRENGLEYIPDVSEIAESFSSIMQDFELAREVQ